MPLIREAIDLGYTSVMIDGSRLSLAENIVATRQVVEVAHAAGVACEAELGALMGHEAGPPPPYEELFASGHGFTDVEECAQFVRESGCDWLSVAVGTIHGAVSGALKDKKKVEARLNLEHLERLHRVANIPLVLHGGSGVKREYLLGAIQNGISKINIGTEIRQAYETALRQTKDVVLAQQAVYERTAWLIRDYFEVSDSRTRLNP
jgi:ketose-bisphosphate aldolase